MTTIRIHGRITEDGKLQFDLPEDAPVGEVEITIRLREPEMPDDILPTFTDEELAELSKPEPTPFHLVETGIWADKNIGDSLAWLEERRDERRARRRARWSQE